MQNLYLFSKLKPFLDLIYMCFYQTSITSWIYFTKKRRKKNFSNKTDKKFYEPLEIKLEEWREKIPKRKYSVLFFLYFPDKQGKKTFNNCNVIKYQFLQHRLSVISTENILLKPNVLQWIALFFHPHFMIPHIIQLFMRFFLLWNAFLYCLKCNLRWVVNLNDCVECNDPLNAIVCSETFKCIVGRFWYE